MAITLTKNTLIVFLLLTCLGLGGYYIYVRRGPTSSSGDGGNATDVTPLSSSNRERDLKKDISHTEASSDTNKILNDDQKPLVTVKSGDPLDEYDIVEQALAPLQEDLDSSDPKVIVAAARQLMTHDSSAVRLEAVDFLSWAGIEGFADLTRMLRDADPEVASEALSAWALEVQDFDDSENIMALIEEVGQLTLTKGTDDFQEVMQALMVKPDAEVLPILKNFAMQTDDPELLELIIDDVNFRAQPEGDVESKEEIQRAIDEFTIREAQEAAEEAAHAEMGFAE